MLQEMYTLIWESFVNVTRKKFDWEHNMSQDEN